MASITAYTKLEGLKQELASIEPALIRAKENLERLEKIPVKALTEKCKTDLEMAKRWLEKLQKRFDAVKLQADTIELGIKKTMQQAKPFMSRSGKPMRP